MMALPVHRPEGLLSIAWNPFARIREREDIAALRLPFPFGPMPANYTRLIRQHYLAAVTYVDGLIGDVLAEVDNRTVVAVVGDHGWSLGERGEFAKFGNFEEKTRVPFVVYHPANPVGKAVQGGYSIYSCPGLEFWAVIGSF